MLRLGFTPVIAGIFDIDQAFRLASELDLQFLELTFDLQEALPTSQPVPRVLELMRATGIAVSVHLSFVDFNLASLMPGVRENSVDRVMRGLEYAEELNAICAVLHSGLTPLRHPLMLEYARQKITQSLSEIALLNTDLAGSARIPIALENLGLNTYDIVRGVAELEAITTLAGFGNCIDVGHAVVEGAVTQRLEGGMGGIGNGIKCLESYLDGLSHTIHFHLHDNDGRSDQHLALGQGIVPWHVVRSKMNLARASVNLEVGPDQNAVRESVNFFRALLD